MFKNKKFIKINEAQIIRKDSIKSVFMESDVDHNKYDVVIVYGVNESCRVIFTEDNYTNPAYERCRFYNKICEELGVK